MPKATSHKLLEVACFGLESCWLAEQAGADRIEFCQDYSTGGLTPLHDGILKLKERLHIPLHVIIRPRSGHFVYSGQELETMRQDIAFCKEAGVNGVVFGILNDEREIDIAACVALVKEAGSMALTFHRAFDACTDLQKSIRDLIDIGFHRVLTSGGKLTALEGIPALKQLQKNYGDDIVVMPGGGIRSSNIHKIIDSTSCHEYHTAAIIPGTERPDTEELKTMIKYLKA